MKPEHLPLADPGREEEAQRRFSDSGDILFRRNGAPTLRQLREAYLTPEETRAAEDRERDPL